MGWPVGLRHSRVEDKVDGSAFFGDYVEDYFNLVDRANKHPIFRVSSMHNETTLRLDALDDGIDKKSEHEGTCRVSLLRALMAAQPLIAEAQVGLVF